MLQAVVGNYSIKGVIAKRQARGIGLGEVCGGSMRAVEIRTKGDELASVGIEAARAGAEVEHTGARADGSQYFMHVTVLAGSATLCVRDANGAGRAVQGVL